MRGAVRIWFANSAALFLPSMIVQSRTSVEPGLDQSSIATAIRPSAPEFDGLDDLGLLKAAAVQAFEPEASSSLMLRETSVAITSFKSTCSTATAGVLSIATLAPSMSLNDPIRKPRMRNLNLVYIFGPISHSQTSGENTSREGGSWVENTSDGISAPLSPLSLGSVGRSNGSDRVGHAVPRDRARHLRLNGTGDRDAWKHPAATADPRAHGT